MLKRWPVRAKVLVGVLTVALTVLSTVPAVAERGRHIPTLKEITPNPVPLSWRPLSRYGLRMHEYFLFSTAEEILVHSCMRHFGLQDPIAGIEQSLPWGLEQEATQDRFRYGISDRQIASVYGYARPAMKHEAGHRPPFHKVPGYDRVYNPMPGQELGRFHGKPVPRGGCLGAAGKVLYGTTSAEQQFTYGDDLAIRADAQLFASRLYQDLNQQWRACMQQVGRATDPHEEFWPTGVSQRQPGEPAQTNEIAIAMDDLDCRQHLHVQSQLSHAEAHLQRLQIQHHRHALNVQLTKKQEALRRANRVIVLWNAGRPIRALTV